MAVVRSRAPCDSPLFIVLSLPRCPLVRTCSLLFNPFLLDNLFVCCIPSIVFRLACTTRFLSHSALVRIRSICGTYNCHVARTSSRTQRASSSRSSSDTASSRPSMLRRPTPSSHGAAWLRPLLCPATLSFQRLPPPARWAFWLLRRGRGRPLAATATVGRRAFVISLPRCARFQCPQPSLPYLSPWCHGGW